MLDDDYGGLLLEGKPTLFKNQPIQLNNSTSLVGNSFTMNTSSKYSQSQSISSTPQINSLQVSSASGI